MDFKEIIDKTKPELEKVIAFLENELAKIRTSQASPALVEDIVIECFGQNFPLKQLGTISCPGRRQIIIQPWDRSYLESIEKALSRAGLGISPVVDREIIRIDLPSLSEEYRKDLISLLSKKKEEAKKTIRRWREKAWKEIQDGSKEGKIREDDKFRAKDALQDLIDEYSEKIEEIGERKRKEILE